MIVERIGMERFMSYTELTHVDLPSEGIVLVTGDNGAGKSSLIEAVSVALWGKTLRGTAPWHDGVQGAVEVSLCDGRVVMRARTAKGKNEVKFRERDLTMREFDTATKAQAALDPIVGSHDVWKRTCVFSSQDAAHFTLATDAERKRLLEKLLGLERFDAALVACRRDLHVAEATLGKRQFAHALHIERVRAEAERRARAQASLDALPQPIGTIGEIEAVLVDCDARAASIARDVRVAN